MGEMKLANAYEEERRIKDGFGFTLVTAASTIAAVFLAREPDISRLSQLPASVAAHSVS